jgi:hypothetical protein
MSIAPHPRPVARHHRPLDFVLTGALFEEEEINPKSSAILTTQPPAAPEPEPGPDFRSIVRANLRAAAQHAALGHKAPSFRRCPHASCKDANNLVPHLVPAELGVTDAELDAILGRAPAAALEAVSLEEELLVRVA